MGIIQPFRLALKSLAASKMRALLTMLGIIIGVGSVILIMSLGNGMQQMIVDTFESIGTNNLNVSLHGRGSTRNVTVSDMYELVSDNSDSIKYMSPTVNVSAVVKHENKTYTPSVTGVSEDYMKIKAWELENGRFLNYIDIAKLHSVCVVGSYYQSEVFSENPVGKHLKINGNIYTIVGVLSEIADSSDSMGSDNIILIPYSNASRISGTAITSYVFVSQSDDMVDIAKRAIETRLYKEYRDENAYYIMNMAEMLDSLTQISDTVVVVLSSIAGISLLVGGIGIMNIMLVSVTERTREIGIRKALGAKRRDIRVQFVIEAGTTSAIGGVFGIISGIALAQVAGGLFDITAIPTISSILLSFGISVGIGIVFGFLPANKAAKLNPIDALRYD